nr:unnamed protein product [Callosobruchus chinensis]
MHQNYSWYHYLIQRLIDITERTIRGLIIVETSTN